MTNLPSMKIVQASYLDIVNGLEKLIDDLNLLTGPGSLIKFDSDGSRIAHLIKLDVLP
jgi:hypothetical protein